MFTAQSRLLLFSAACLATTGAIASGCTSGRGTVSSTATTAAGQSTIPAATPGTTGPDPDTIPTPTPSVPATSGDPAMLDCGTLYRAVGWPTTFVPNPEPIRCLQTAFDGGTPARLVDREQTDGNGGAILVTTYETLGPGRVRVTVDATEAADRPQTTTITECARLTTEFVTITVSECTDEAN